MNEESHNPSIDPELEARIAALVLGEASDFESDELNRLIDQRPELAELKKQLQCVHGLLQDVATGEPVAEEDDWKLSADKRSTLLAVLEGEAVEEPPVQVVHRSAAEPRSARANLFWNLTKIAAVFCVAGFFGGLLFVTNSTDRAREVASHDAFTPQSVDAEDDFLYAETAAVPEEMAAADYEHSTPSLSKRFARSGAKAGAGAAAGSGVEYDAKKSNSALSAIRQSLGVNESQANSPHYLRDDVQYVPATPSFTVPTPTGAPEQQIAELSESAPKLALSTGLIRPEPAPKPVDPACAITSDAPATVTAPAKAPAAPMSTSLALPAYASGVRSGLRGGDESPLAADTYGDAMGNIDGFDMGDRPENEKRGESRPTTGSLAWGTQKQGQGQRFGNGRSRKSANPNFDFPMDLDDSRSAGEMKRIDRIAAGGNRQGGGGGRAGGGGFGGGGIAVDGAMPKDQLGDKFFTQPASPRDFGTWADAGEGEAKAPAKPNVTDLAGSPGEKVAESFSRGKYFGFGGQANAIPNPTNEWRVQRGFNKEKGRAEHSVEYENGDGSGKDSGASLSDDHIALGLDLADRGQTATEQGQPGGGQANQSGGWGYAQNSTRRLGMESKSDSDPSVKRESGQPDTTTRADVTLNFDSRVQKSLGELSVLNKLHENSGNTTWELFKSKQDEEGGEMAPQDGDPAGEGRDHWRGYVPPMLVDDSKSIKKLKKQTAPAGLNEKTAVDEAFSTFSLHVSDVSFKLALSALAHGEWPEAAKVRIEEFVNAFDYGDPMPSQSERVACRLEQSIHPFLQQRNLLRVSMRTAAAGRSGDTPLRLTLLLDNSGSMERIDRQQTVRRAFALLANQLKPIDQVTLISFARRPRLLADKVSGAQSSQLVELIDSLPSEGGTNVEAALQLAFEKAQEQRLDNAQNRIILLTDGAVNLGDANPDSLSQMITKMRAAGIAFDAAGISAEGLNDEILEALTRKGDGRYYLLDSLDAADDGFARQIAGALRPSAKNVKVQIEFNPKRVGRYKLLGFEKHRLKQEDFRNDTVDAAEMAAAEAGVAVYQFEAKPDGEGDVGSVSVRFRDVSTGRMVENCWPIPYEADAPRVDQAAPSLRIAASAALLAAKLRGEPLGESIDLRSLSDLMAGLPDQHRSAERVQQLQLMIQQARQMNEK